MKHDKLTQLSYTALPKTLHGVNSEFAFFLFGCFPGNFSEVSAKVSLVAPEHYLYHIKFSADFEYWLRLGKKKGIYLSDIEVVYIRRHDRVAATYMVTKGEYLEESIEVYENIINDLSAHIDRKKLIKFYNISICSFHLRSAIKAALMGRFEAIRSFMRLSSPIFWPKGLQIIGCLPFALSESLRHPVTIMYCQEYSKRSLTVKCIMIKSKRKSVVIHFSIFFNSLYHRRDYLKKSLGVR